MATGRVVRVVVSCFLAAGIAVVGSGAQAQATPAGEAAAVARLQQQWSKMSMQQKLGTCNAYRRNATVMTNAAAETAWSSPATRRGLSKASWKRVYRTYFAWACSGAGRSPRP